MTDAALLQNLRARVLDETESLAGLLRACLVLGAVTGSENLRSWAGRELKGYADDEEVPSYRMQILPLYMDSVSGNYWSKGQSISPLQIPATLREHIPESMQFKQPVDELEQLAASSDDSLRIGSQGFPALAAMWSQELPMFQDVQALYWRVSTSTLAGMLGMVRTTLVEMVVDMTHDVPYDGLPTKSQVDSAVQVHVHGPGDHYQVTVGTNSGVIGQGAGSTQTQHAGVTPADLAQLIVKMRDALAEVTDPDDRSDVEQAIDDFEEAVSEDDPEPEKVQRRSRALNRIASAVGGAILVTAASEGTQAAIGAFGAAIG